MFGFVEQVVNFLYLVKNATQLRNSENILLRLKLRVFFCILLKSDFNTAAYSKNGLQQL